MQFENALKLTISVQFFNGYAKAPPAAPCGSGDGGGLDRRDPSDDGDGFRLPLGEWELTKEEKGDRVAAREEAMADVIWPSPFFSLSLLFFSFSFSLSPSSSLFLSLKLSVRRLNEKFLSLLKLTCDLSGFILVSPRRAVRRAR